MNYLKGLLGPVVLPLLGLIALADTGCATTIASKYPHLDWREICVHLPGTEPDASEYLITDEGAVISNFHPEIVDRVAPSVRTGFKFHPDADPGNTKYLPAPYDQLECAPVFSMLPSKDAETAPLPAAAVDLLVHEPRPEPVPRSVADKLASCATLNRSPLQSDQYTMTFNVYVRDDGQAVSALLVESTLGDRPTERCIVDVLGSAQWPTVTAHLTAASEPGLRSASVGLEPAEAPLGVRSFFAQPAPNQPAPPLGDRPSGVYRIQPPPPPPVSVPPGGARIPPSVFVIPMGTVAVAVLAFGVVYYLSSNDAPAWSLTMNPMTGKRYTSQQEYDEVQGRAAKKLLKRPPLRIAAIQSLPPPAPAPSPAPVPPPATGTRRNPGQTCDDSVLDELEKQKRQICTSEEWSCSDDFERIGKKKEKRLTCLELLPRLARGQACLNARLRIQAECYAGSPESKHDDQIDGIRKAVKWCADKAAVRGPNGGPCQ